MYSKVSLFAVIALATLALCEPGREEFKAARAKCAEEIGVDVATMKERTLDDQKMKCLGACMMKQRGHMKDDGTMDIEKAVEQLPKHIPDYDRIVAAIQECGTKKGENDCETAHQIWQCLGEKNALPHKRGPPPAA